MARTYTYVVGRNVPTGGGSEVPVPAGYRVTFEDFFNGTSVDTTKWNVRNEESLSYDLARIKAANAVVSGGYLRLQVKEESASGRNYTSAYLDSIGKFTQRYGLWQCRAKINTVPNVSKGIWPAPLWLRGDSSIGAVGEIDLVESWGTGAAGPILGWREGSAQGSIHQSTNGGGGKVSGFMSSPGVILSDDFHLWECEWTSTFISLRLDGVEKVRATPTNAPWAFTGPEYSGAFNMRVNIQVGGYYGDPEASTEFPTECLVDYIRVLEKV